jgi:hypothetical protein
MDALLFSLPIAVGITPQPLPAVVSTSLAAGSRSMALVADKVGPSTLGWVSIFPEHGSRSGGDDVTVSSRPRPTRQAHQLGRRVVDVSRRNRGTAYVLIATLMFAASVGALGYAMTVASLHR